MERVIAIVTDFVQAHCDIGRSGGQRVETRRLGSTQRSVSCVGLGSMPLAIGGRPSEQEAIHVLHAAFDAGVNWVDTADSYCLGEKDVGYGERLIARAVRERGTSNEVFVTTKAGYVRPNGGWELDCRPERLKAACEASLRALGVESIGLFQLHGVDPRVDYRDSVGALWELKHQGKIQHIGLSNVDQVHIRQACEIVNVATVQNRCNVFERHCFANGVIDFCERRGIAFIAHSPVGGHKSQDGVANDPVLRQVAKRHGATPYQVALAWLLGRSPAMLVIPGASRVESVHSSAGAAALSAALSDNDWAELNRSFPPAGFLLKQLVGARREGRHALRWAKQRLRGLPA